MLLWCINNPVLQGKATLPRIFLRKTIVIVLTLEGNYSEKCETVRWALDCSSFLKCVAILCCCCFLFLIFRSHKNSYNGSISLAKVDQDIALCKEIIARRLTKADGRILHSLFPTYLTQKSTRRWSARTQNGKRQMSTSCLPFAVKRHAKPLY